MQNGNKILRMRYNFLEIAQMLNVTPKTLRQEIRHNTTLSDCLSRMDLGTIYKRPLKKHVIEIFKHFGFPEGYEHYNTI
jgi:IS30 family transposase